MGAWHSDKSVGTVKTTLKVGATGADATSNALELPQRDPTEAKRPGAGSL
jgi:hypothetical protein